MYHVSCRHNSFISKFLNINICIILSVKSFIALCNELFEEDGVSYILSEKLSQDPLEEHFAYHRQVGGTCENPTLETFQRQEVASNLVKNELVSGLKGNTLGRPDTRDPVSVDDERLPRKRSK